VALAGAALVSRNGQAELRGVQLRRARTKARCVLFPAFTLGVQALGCSGERYARPAGPVPVYEEAPVLAWDAGATPETPAARVPLLDRARWADNGLRLSAPSVIQGVAERAGDERRNNKNVSDDQQSR